MSDSTVPHCQNRLTRFDVKAREAQVIGRIMDRPRPYCEADLANAPSVAQLVKHRFPATRAGPENITLGEGRDY